MNSNELINILNTLYRKHMERYFVNGELLYKPDEIIPQRRDENIIVNAILNSLKKKGEFQDLYDEIMSTNTDSLSPFAKTKLMRFIEPTRIPEKTRNAPIGCLLALYKNKKSRKVVFAREQLQSRYQAQSWKDQKRILRTFLESDCKSDHEWAAKKLYNDWDECFSNDLIRIWEGQHQKSVGITVLKHCPKEYSITQVEEFEKSGIERHHIAIELAGEPGFPFKIDRQNIRGQFYLYVLAKLGMDVNERYESRREFIDAIRWCKFYVEFNDGQDFPGNILDFPCAELKIWSMGKLGMTDSLVRLLKITQVLNDINPQPGKDFYQVLIREAGFANYQKISACDEYELEKVLNNPNIPDNVKDFIQEFSYGLDE